MYFVQIHQNQLRCLIWKNLLYYIYNILHLKCTTNWINYFFSLTYFLCMWMYSSDEKSLFSFCVLYVGFHTVSEIKFCILDISMCRRNILLGRNLPFLMRCTFLFASFLYLCSSHTCPIHLLISLIKFSCDFNRSLVLISEYNEYIDIKKSLIKVLMKKIKFDINWKILPFRRFSSSFVSI